MKNKVKLPPPFVFEHKRPESMRYTHMYMLDMQAQSAYAMREACAEIMRKEGEHWKAACLTRTGAESEVAFERAASAFRLEAAIRSLVIDNG